MSNLDGILHEYCSWCYEKTKHRLVEKNRITRNDYQCQECENFTAQCRIPNCTNMTAGRAQDSDENSFFQSLKENWTNENCAEHAGDVANFEKLSLELEDLADYQQLFEDSKFDVIKAGKIAGGIVAGATVFAPLAFLAAPGIAAAIGTTGILGAASTGTAISALSGAALTSASLAAIGPAGMIGGTIFLTATGAALGSVRGGVISNSYFGAIKDFKIQKIKDGKGPALIFINGFLSQKNQSASDWEKAVQKQFPENPYYFVTWESSSLYKMGSSVGKDGFRLGVQEVAKVVIPKGGHRLIGKFNPLSWVSFLSDLVDNPWHTAMVKASMTGVLLADLIARTNQKDGFILMGHSLGARVIYYLLNALGTKTKTSIRDVYLLGGAVGVDDQEGWENALKAVNGNLYNCFSCEDSVLKVMYQGANAMLSRPIGLEKITISDPRMKNIDTSFSVKGHMEYKEKFGGILDDIAFGQISDIEKLTKAIEMRFSDIRPSNDEIWTSPPALKVIDCVLSLHRDYDKFVVPRVRQFRKKNPKIQSLPQLKGKMEEFDSLEDFGVKELDYNYRKQMVVLYQVIHFLLEIQDNFKNKTEIKRLEAWAKWARPGDYLMAGIKGFRLAGFQYLRMLFGAQTVKPDVHIKTFVSDAIRKEVTDIRALYLMELVGAKMKLPLRDLDAAIWEAQAR